FGLRRHAVDIAPAPHLLDRAEDAGKNPDAVFELKVDDRDSVLRVAPQDERAFTEGYEKALGRLYEHSLYRRSLNSIYSFDSREGAGSVSVLTVPQLINIEFSYSKRAAQGLLTDALKFATSRDINLTRVTTYLSGWIPAARGADCEERGVAQIVGHTAPNSD